MSGDLLRRLLRCFGRPAEPAGTASAANLDQVDKRLDGLERKQSEIDARLILMERQADPRRLRDDG